MLLNYSILPATSLSVSRSLFVFLLFSLIQKHIPSNFHQTIDSATWNSSTILCTDSTCFFRVQYFMKMDHPWIIIIHLFSSLLTIISHLAYAKPYSRWWGPSRIICSGVEEKNAKVIAYLKYFLFLLH